MELNFVLKTERNYYIFVTPKRGKPKPLNAGIFLKTFYYEKNYRNFDNCIYYFCWC